MPVSMPLATSSVRPPAARPRPSGLGRCLDLAAIALAFAVVIALSLPGGGDPPTAPALARLPL